VVSRRSCTCRSAALSHFYKSEWTSHVFTRTLTLWPGRTPHHLGCSPGRSSRSREISAR